MPPTALFDLDGTLTTLDSAGAFLATTIAKSPPRLAVALLVLPVALPLLFWAKTRRGGTSIFFWLASVGKTHDRFFRELRTFVRRTFDGERRVNVEVLAMLRERLRDGHRVAIVTGAPTSLVRCLARAHGIRASSIGSRLKAEFHGLVCETHCIGERKVERVRSVEGLERWDEVFSDSLLDLPLMRRARIVWLVRPSRRTVRRVRARLPAQIEVRVLGASRREKRRSSLAGAHGSASRSASRR